MADTLSRAEQDAILYPVAEASAMLRLWWFHEIVHERAEMLRIRRGLRLDDKSLDHAIAYGAHKHPWQSAPDKDRARTAVS